MNVNFQIRQDAQLLWPKFLLEEFFDGPVTGWGVTQSRFGSLQNQFRIASRGKWKARANALHLTETYAFDDGHIDTLEWKIVREDSASYRGDEANVQGKASGVQEGNSFRWRYSRLVPRAERGCSVSTIASGCRSPACSSAVRR